jgi:polyphenol oxidase
MFRFSKKGPVEYLESTALSSCNFLIHAFCTRWSGVSEEQFSSLNFSAREGDAANRIHKNKEIIASSFSFFADQFLTVHQIHGNQVLIVDRKNIGAVKQRQRQCDAIVTDQPGLAIGVKTADCVPILMADREKQVIGVVHAGWRGTSLNIAAQAVSAFTDVFSSRFEDILAVIGPAIGPCCYQVDEAVYKANADDRVWESAFMPCREEGKWMLNLPAANRLQLLETGIFPENVCSADICTCCRTDIFFSHRGEGGKTGRQISFMMLAGDNKPIIKMD